MTVFAEYALYYDLFYAGKDYGAEADFVHRVITRYVPHATSIIELGCGTAVHAIEFARKGYHVMGVDRSATMLARAEERLATMPETVQSNIALHQSDITTLTVDRRFDAATSLFHVSNYQTTNEALLAFLRCARAAITDNGVFIFDFWYGPAVLTDPPSVRVREVIADGQTIIRTASPALDVNRNLVTVNYQLRIKGGTGDATPLAQEVHAMRYLFLPEIEALAAQADFHLAEAATWMSDQPLGVSTWHGLAVLRPGGHPH